MQKKLSKKMAFLAMLLLVTMLLSTGCDKNKIEKSAVNDFIDSKVSETITALNERDVKLARNIWSDLSELSVNLQAQDEEELSGYVAELALSYEKLISYCNDGDADYQAAFKADFKTASENLMQALEQAGYDCSELGASLESVYQ